MNFSDTIGSVLKSKDESKVLWVTPDQSVYDAIEKMAQHGIGALLVISNHKLVGILSERAYARKEILMAPPPKEPKPDKHTPARGGTGGRSRATSSRRY